MSISLFTIMSAYLHMNTVINDLFCAFVAVPQINLLPIVYEEKIFMYIPSTESFCSTQRELELSRCYVINMNFSLPIDINKQFTSTDFHGRNIMLVFYNLLNSCLTFSPLICKLCFPQFSFNF